MCCTLCCDKFDTVRRNERIVHTIFMHCWFVAGTKRTTYIGRHRSLLVCARVNSCDSVCTSCLLLFYSFFSIYYCFHAKKLCSLNDIRANLVKSVGINFHVQVMHMCLKLFRTSNVTLWALSGDKNGFSRVIVIGANGLCFPHFAE